MSMRHRARPGTAAFRSVAMALAIVLVGCGPAEPPASTPARKDTQPAATTGGREASGPPAADTTLAGAIALPASFAGTLPCADCEGIDTTLTLAADFSYRQRSRYLGKPAGADTFVEAGRFAVSDAGTRLTLYGPGAEPVTFAIQGPGQLTRLDRAGQPIDSPLNYTLQRAPAIDPVAESGVRLGLFTYFADAPQFVDCATGERLPVAMRDGYLALEKAYTSAGTAGAPRLVRVRGRVLDLTGMEESRGPEPTLVVDAFVELVGNEVRCARTRAPFEGTRWLLTRLGDKPVTAAPGSVPEVVFDPAGARLRGNTGCNALSGGYDYSVTSGAITVGPITTTEADCPSGAVAELAYVTAIQRATRTTIDGETLLLADEQGELAAFRAEYPATGRP